MARYYLMNRDEKLLEFNIETTALGEDVSQLNSFSELRPVGFKDIVTWLNNRNYAKHKDHFKRWLKEWGINTTKGFVDITHCLGINDCLWVKPVDSHLAWDEVSLYKNDFSDVAQNTAFETGLYGLQLSSTEIISPEFTSDGTAPKCWKNEDGKIYLYKSCLSGAANYGLEANAEYMAADIARQIVGTESIPYELVSYKDRLCSKCELFTSEEYGYVPFYKYIDTGKHYTLNDILKICSNMGYENEFRKMILVDSIVFNQDRHLGNFGFLVDNKDFKIKGFAPLFDYNSSMLCNTMQEDILTMDAFHEYEKNYMLGHKLGGSFSDIGQAILTPQLKTLIPKTIQIPVHEKYNYPNDRIRKLAAIFDENISKITESRSYHVDCKILKEDKPKQRRSPVIPR